jgi:hypothetical protein
MSKTRLFLFVLAVFLSSQSLVGNASRPSLLGTGLAAIGVGSEDWCELVCGPSVECSTECWAGDPGFLTDCGNYNGSPGGYCLGYCGDAYCNVYADELDSESSSFCEVDCGPATPSCDECEVWTNQGCSSGLVCNAAKCCVDPEIVDPPDPGPPCASGFCLRKSDCCPDEVCVDVGGEISGVCIPDHPAQLVCPI